MLVEELDACAFFFPEDVGEWDQEKRGRTANLLSTAKDLDEVVFASLSRV
jgi:hypothetical protein